MKKIVLVGAVLLAGSWIAWASSPLAVTIIEPASGKVFGLGDIVVVKVVPQGDLAHILTVRSNGNIAQSFEILSGAWLGVEQEFAFKLSLVGSGTFAASLEGADGSYALADCPYYVAESAPPQMSGLSVPYFEQR